jgi:hypothetical protein
MIITALSLKDYGLPHNNYASLVETGHKPIETRTWTTKHRGDILICCSKSSKSENASLAVCVVELWHIEPMIPEHESFACCSVYPRANSWFLRNHRKLSRKFPVTGSLNTFPAVVPNDVEFIPTGLFDAFEAIAKSWLDNNVHHQLSLKL